ncbi:MAG: hypothetical protein GY833_21455 [Aestuariibacter sp.]|nr:hypothetical protein [Aestuariibacter sp.]|tara:strand:- start:1181 stop:1699 length:519 start_codon:yes stop_codon:yes gene_type:complete
MSHKNKVEMIAVVTRTTKKKELEIVAFADGKYPAGTRKITLVKLEDTICFSRTMKMMENIMLAAWFNQYDPKIPLGQQALVVLISADSLSLKGHFEVEPLGHAQMTNLEGKPLHLPTATLSTRKKLFAMHWDQMRGLVRQWEDFHADKQADSSELVDGAVEVMPATAEQGES